MCLFIVSWYKKLVKSFRSWNDCLECFCFSADSQSWVNRQIGPQQISCFVSVLVVFEVDLLSDKVSLSVSNWVSHSALTAIMNSVPLSMPSYISPMVLLLILQHSSLP